MSAHSGPQILSELQGARRADALHVTDASGITGSATQVLATLSSIPVASGSMGGQYPFSALLQDFDHLAHQLTLVPRTASAAAQFSTFLSDISAVVGTVPVTSAFSLPSATSTSGSASTSASQSTTGSGSAAAQAATTGAKTVRSSAGSLKRHLTKRALLPIQSGVRVSIRAPLLAAAVPLPLALVLSRSFYI